MTGIHLLVIVVLHAFINIEQTVVILEIKLAFWSWHLLSLKYLSFKFLVSFKFDTQVANPSLTHISKKS